MLGKIETLPSIAGKIVHQMAAEMVQGNLGKSADKPGAAAAMFTAVFDRLFMESATGLAWQRDPKRGTRLFEHHYGLPADQLAASMEKAAAAGRAAAAGLATSEALARARVSQLEEVEQLTKTEIAGVKVWVKIDVSHGETPRAHGTLAHLSPVALGRFRALSDEGVIYLVDWKSGRRKPEHQAQVILYAAYQLRGRGVSLDRQRVVLSYLADGSEVVVQPDPEAVALFEQQLPAAALEIHSRLEPPGEINLGPEENFPRTEDLSECRLCRMLEVCKGKRTID